MREAEEPQGSLLDSGIRRDAAHRDPRLWILLLHSAENEPRVSKAGSKGCQGYFGASSDAHPPLKTTTYKANSFLGKKKNNKTDRVWNLPAFCCLISPSQASLNCVESQPGADVQKPADASSRQGLVSRLRILTRGSLRIIFLQTFWYSTC